MITEDEIRYYKQLDERQGRLFLGMNAKLLGRSGTLIVGISKTKPDIFRIFQVNFQQRKT